MKEIFNLTFSIFFKTIGAISIVLGILSVLRIGNSIYENPDIASLSLVLSLTFVFSVSYSIIRYKRKIDKIKIAYFTNFLIYVPIYVAKQKKYFKHERLQVQFVECGNDDRVWELVSAKEADFGISDPSLIIDSNIKSKIISSIVQGALIWAVSKKQIPYSTNIDIFKNKEIAVYPHPSTAYCLANKIKDILDGKIELREMEFGSEANFINNESIDIVILTEPLLTEFLDKIPNCRIVFSFSQYFDNILFTALYSTEKFLNEKPKVAQKLTNAIQRSLSYIHQHKLETIELLKKEFPEFGENTILEAYSRLLKCNSIPENVSISPDSWRKIVNLREYDADLKLMNYIDNSFAKNSIKNSTATYIIYKK